METTLKLNTAIILLALTALFFGACKGGHSPAAMAGTYANHAAGEFSIADDTLVVEHDQDQHYFIHRKTGYKVLDDKGKAGKLKLEAEEWKAVYDPNTGVMTESRKGRVISFEASKGLLMLENSSYRRIN